MYNTVCLLKRSKLNGPGIHYGVGYGIVSPSDQSKIIVHEVHHKDTNGWHRESLVGFAAGHQATIEQHFADPTIVDVSIKRLNFMYTYRDAYEFFTDNCEHAARGVVTGRTESRQIDILAGVAIVGLGIGLYYAIRKGA